MNKWVLGLVFVDEKKAREYVGWYFRRLGSVLGEFGSVLSVLGVKSGEKLGVFCDFPDIDHDL